MEKIIEKASDIIRSRSSHGEDADHYCVLSQIDIDGNLTASVITAAHSQGIEWVTFCTGLGSNKTQRIEQDSRACCCFCSDHYSITLKGKLEVITDPDVKRENWYDGLVNHFSGPDDPNYCVLRLKTERYSLFVDWEETSGTL